MGLVTYLSSSTNQNNSEGSAHVAYGYNVLKSAPSKKRRSHKKKGYGSYAIFAGPTTNAAVLNRVAAIAKIAIFEYLLFNIPIVPLKS